MYGVAHPLRGAVCCEVRVAAGVQVVLGRTLQPQVVFLGVQGHAGWHLGHRGICCLAQAGVVKKSRG